MNLKALAGRTIEQHIGRQIQGRYAVIMTANIETDGKHGPRMEGGNGNDKIVLADMQIYGVRRGWLEVKAKSHPMLFQNWNRFEHGIDEDKFLAYCSLQERTCLPVYLMICDVGSGEILMADLDTLQTTGSPRVGTWPDNGKPSVNWDRKAFTKVGTFSVPNDDLTRLVAVWDWKSLDTFFSQLELPVRRSDETRSNARTAAGTRRRIL